MHNKLYLNYICIYEVYLFLKLFMKSCYELLQDITINLVVIIVYYHFYRKSKTFE